MSSKKKKTKKLTLADLKKALGGATPIQYENAPAGDESWVGRIDIVPGGRGTQPQKLGKPSTPTTPTKK
jgi:hypothetical protein